MVLEADIKELLAAHVEKRAIKNLRAQRSLVTTIYSKPSFLRAPCAPT